jgi:hypothetical protein
MAKRKRSDLNENIMGMVVDKLAVVKGLQFAEEFRDWIPDLLSAEDRGETTTAATDFTLQQVYRTFGLKSIVFEPSNTEQYIWRVEESKLDFPMTPCLRKLPLPFACLPLTMFGDRIVGGELF